MYKVYTYKLLMHKIYLCIKFVLFLSASTLLVGLKAQEEYIHFINDCWIMFKKSCKSH